VTAIVTSGLLLRPWRPDDLAQLTRLLGDPEVTRYIVLGEPFTPEDVAEMSARSLEQWGHNGFGPWVAIEKATGRWVGRIGLVAPHHGGEERRLLLPPPADGHPEHGPSDAAIGVADLRVLGQLPAKLMAASVMTLPSWIAWPGGLPCPWNLGTVDTVACQETAGGKRWSQRSRPCIRTAGRWPARVPSWLVERLRLGVGHASTVRPDPSTLGVVGERGSRHEGRSPARSR